MSKTLKERLQEAIVLLDNMNNALSTNPSVLPRQTEESFRAFISLRTEIINWINIIEARDLARQFLDGLENQVNAQDQISCGSINIPFQQARLLGVLAYLSTNWSLADSITAKLGRILCTKESGSNEASPAKLISHFIARGMIKKTAGALFDSLHSSFGWPVGIFYTIRNKFVHAGALFEGDDVFEGPSSGSSFKMKMEAWQDIVNSTTLNYEVVPSLLRSTTIWPPNPRDDLRGVLKVCETEMDEVLGILVGSALGLIQSHLAFMLGEN